MSKILCDNNERTLNSDKSSLKPKVKRRLLPRAFVDPDYATCPPPSSRRSMSPDHTFGDRELNNIWESPPADHACKEPCPVMIKTPVHDKTRSSTGGRRHIQSKPSSLTERLLRLANKQDNFDLTPHVVVPINLENVFKRTESDSEDGSEDSVADNDMAAGQQPLNNHESSLPLGKVKVVNRELLQECADVLISSTEDESRLASSVLNAPDAIALKSREPKAGNVQPNPHINGQPQKHIVVDEVSNVDAKVDQSVLMNISSKEQDSTVEVPSTKGTADSMQLDNCQSASKIRDINGDIPQPVAYSLSVWKIYPASEQQRRKQVEQDGTHVSNKASHMSAKQSNAPRRKSLRQVLLRLKLDGKLPLKRHRTRCQKNRWTIRRANQHCRRSYSVHSV